MLITGDARWSSLASPSIQHLSSSYKYFKVETMVSTRLRSTALIVRGRIYQRQVAARPEGTRIISRMRRTR